MFDVAQRLVRIQLGIHARYLGAFLVVAACLALRSQLPSTALPYLFFIPGLMCCGFWFGVGPSLMACALAVLAAQYFFIAGTGFEGDWRAWINSVSFGIVSLGMAIVCALFRQNLTKLHDINNRLEDEVETRTLERDGIWNVSPDLICALSENGELLAMNPAWHLETGWTEQELKAGGFSTYISPEQLSSSFNSLSKHPIIELDTQSVRKNGDPIHLNWRIARRQGQHFAVARDITVFKERQEALEQAKSQLQQSQKMETIGQLTGGLAHDFNNLLTVISGSLEMLQKRIAQGRSQDFERYVALAQQATVRAASITHRLLAYARRQPLVSKEVDPTLLIQDMHDLISRTLSPRIELALVAPSAMVMCICDAHQLENAILNLCINARDAMPQGGRLQIQTDQVTISHAVPGSSLSVGEYVRIRVTDTGTGMPASVVQRAFDPFFTTKPPGSGTGLGLSMVYGFARQSSGEAQISSAVAQGTTVSLFLPSYQGAMMEGVAATALLSRESEIARQVEVLVVDDEAAICDLVAEALEEIGCHVTKAATAADAMRYLTELSGLRLLVTDIGLRGETGGDELAITALQALPNLRVLFISGSPPTTVPSEALEDVRIRMLRKPFAMNELRSEVEQLLGLS
jgi:PAS domain S-box-containing protein